MGVYLKPGLLSKIFNLLGVREKHVNGNKLVRLRREVNWPSRLLRVGKKRVNVNKFVRKSRSFWNLESRQRSVNQDIFKFLSSFSFYIPRRYQPKEYRHIWNTAPYDPTPEMSSAPEIIQLSEPSETPKIISLLKKRDGGVKHIYLRFNF